MTSPFLLAIFTGLTFVSTFSGGLVAMRFRNHSSLFMAFSAGTVIAVSLLDLLPQSFQLSRATLRFDTLCALVAAGFIVYMLFDKLAILHTHHDDYNAGSKGRLGAGTFSLHSLLDGILIGLMFQVSVVQGLIVAIAIIVHDFTDGLNTVTYIINSRGNDKTALKWLLIDSIAPVAGVLSTLFFSVPLPVLGMALAMFSGFFLYIGATDLLPACIHHNQPRVNTLMTLAGFIVIYLVVHFAG